MSHQWLIGTDRADGGIVANGELSDTTPARTRGGDVTLTFGFWDEPGIATAHRDRYKALRAYGEYAGSMQVERSVEGVPTYAEDVPPSAPVESLVLDFRPQSSVTDIPGFWGVVRDYSDPTRYPEAAARLEVTVVFLADTSDYATRSDVKAALNGVRL